jgi:hypothetical protein
VGRPRLIRMRYLLIISHDDSFAPTGALVKGIGAWIRTMERRGIRIGGNPLRPPSDATTVRIRWGKALIERGPFSKSREKMCAYELIECPSREDAVAAALRHPMAKAATIKVRPVWTELAG